MSKSLAKVAAAGATIFAVGWGMLVLQPAPEEPVAQADADIFAFQFAQKSQQQRFAETMMLEGMEKPRAYDHNGNKIFFSTTTTTESPKQVLERFQRAFVENGVNESMHLSVGPGVQFVPMKDMAEDRAELARQQKADKARWAYMDDYIGGVVPVLVKDNAVVMMGTSTNDDADTAEEWVGEVAQQRAQIDAPKVDMDISTTVKAMRYVDAFNDGRKTRITAVWSDEQYEAGKIADIGEDLNVDPEIPPCPGCKRLYHIKGETEDDFANMAFNGGGQSVDQVMTFYRRSLQGRGWMVSPTAQVLQGAERQGLKTKTDYQMLQFMRGTEFLTVTAFPGENGTGVNIARSN